MVKASSPTMHSFWSDQVCYSSSAAAKFRHGSCCSRAQMHLHKILYIIQSVPSQETQIEVLGRDGKGLFGDENWLSGRKGCGSDLNLRLGALPEVGGQESSAAENGGFSACSGVGRAAVSDGGVLTVERSWEGECEPKEADGERRRDSDPIEVEANRKGVGSEVVDEKRTELESEITNLESPRSETDNNEKLVVQEEERMTREDKTKSFSEKSGTRDNGYLGLLVEAAKLISGNFGESESESDPELDSDDRLAVTESVIKEEAKGQKRKRMDEYYGGVGDVSPVVRSKRGRTQVLPCRYRDSVLEPLERLARPQRWTMVPAKRRSKR